MQGSNHPSAQATRISLLYLRSMLPSGNRSVSHPLTLSLSSRLIFLIRVHKAASDMYWYRNSSCSNPVHPPGICSSCSFIFKSIVFSTFDSHGAVPTAAFDEERRALLLLHAFPSCPSRFLFVRHLLPSHSARAGCNPKRRIVRAFRSTFAVLRASHSLPIYRACKRAEDVRFVVQSRDPNGAREGWEDPKEADQKRRWKSEFQSMQQQFQERTHPMNTGSHASLRM